jgi:hypothetical protein
MNTTNKIIMMGVLSLCSLAVNAEVLMFIEGASACMRDPVADSLDSLKESIREKEKDGPNLNIKEELHGYEGLPGTILVVGGGIGNFSGDMMSDITYFEGTYEQCSAIVKVFENKKVRGRRAKAAKDEAERAEEDKLKIKRDQVEAARKLTPEYKASEAAGQIRYAKRIIQSANKAIAEEKEIGAISGVMNFNRLHQAGEMIVFNKSVIKSQWGIYKANGGKAGSVDELLASSNK